MKLAELFNFIENEMNMNNIYQSLIIKSLVEAGGSATSRQLAQSFLSQDESQIMYYERKINAMHLPVLKKRGIVTREGELVSLKTKKLSDEQKANIIMLCEKRLQEYISKRGLKIWDHRLLDDPVPETLRYRVLKEAGGRCALCGATKNEKPLHVNHIKPLSKKGKTEYANLQVLCSTCNTAKGDEDDTDFRNLAEQESDPNCKFCYENIKSRITDEFNSTSAMEDKYPVTKGHMLIVPRRHIRDYFSLTEAEKRDADNLIHILKRRISEDDPSVTGFNVGINCGESAGQTIFHAHIHLIPRRDGDIPNPRGGVRGVIPDKMSY
jgi:diadenosine tetraphosphate (Ap4A) HIT family hydrolase/tRNA(His) 5'-end guanylyltransferase